MNFKPITIPATDRSITIELWRSSMTDQTYTSGSIVLWVSLGEGAYGMIVCQPTGEMFLEEIPQYGGEPRFYKELSSVQEGLDIMKTWA